MRLLRAALMMTAITMIWSAGARAATATVHTWGYLPTRDGTLLRYDLLRPAAPANQRLPVLVNYEGYAAGTDATDNGLSTYSDRLMARGYALLGVSVRGTGCSQGQFDPFDHTMGEDGYDAIEWAARQLWSDGKVGMIGVSFGGITQLVTAGQRPPHQRAIAHEPISPSTSTTSTPTARRCCSAARRICCRPEPAGSPRGCMATTGCFRLDTGSECSSLQLTEWWTPTPSMSTVTATSRSFRLPPAEIR